MCTGWCAIARLYSGGRCHAHITTLKIAKVRKGLVDPARRSRQRGDTASAGRSIHPGVAMMSSGAMTSASTRCCTMCALKR